MKKTYQAPSLTVFELTTSQPLLSSGNESQQPTIGNGYDDEGANDQFSLNKNWDTSWTED